MHEVWPWVVAAIYWETRSPQAGALVWRAFESSATPPHKRRRKYSAELDGPNLRELLDEQCGRRKRRR